MTPDRIQISIECAEETVVHEPTNNELTTDEKLEPTVDEKEGKEERSDDEPLPLDDLVFTDDDDDDGTGNDDQEPDNIFYRVQQHGPVYISLPCEYVFLSRQAANRFMRDKWKRKVALNMEELMNKLQTCQFLIAPVWSINRDALAIGQYPLFQPKTLLFLRHAPAEQLPHVDQCLLVGVNITVQIGSLFCRPTEFRLDNYNVPLQSNHFEYIRTRKPGPVTWEDVGCFIANPEVDLWRVEEMQLWLEDIKRGVKRERE